MQMDESSGRVGDLARLFLRLGATAFGGPAAHIALMHVELVQRRSWLSEQDFVDLVGAANMIPGPNSTEVAIHVGYARAGWRGLLTAGACFITPSMVMVGVLAWVYVRYGSLPDVRGVLYGVTPVVVAIIAHALWTFGHTTVKSTWLGCVCVAAVVAAVAGIHELIVLAAGAAAGLAQWTVSSRVATRSAPAGSRRAGALLWVPVLAAAPAAAPVTPVTFGTLAAVFFKTGALLFGSGYVLLAFLRHDLVERLGWLSDQQLLDAVAVAQITPGPLFTTATFVGYVLAGWSGATLATIAIFLPAFVYVALSAPWIPRLRRSPLARAILDGVNVAAVAVMGVVSWQIARAAIHDAVTVAIAAAAALLLLRTRWNSAWLIAGGGIIGWLVRG
jgi:chromate transporter